MAINITINAVNANRFIDRKSIIINNKMTRGVSDCSFTTKSYEGAVLTPIQGQEVIITEGVSPNIVRLFAGIIEDIKRKNKSARLSVFDVSCTDFSLLANRRLVFENYTNQTVNAIIADINTKYLTGFTVTNVACPIVIATIRFDGQPVIECLKTLAEQVNFDWFIDFDRGIHFFERGVRLAPWGLTDTNDNYIFDSLEISQSLNEIRNHIFIRGKATGVVAPFIVQVSDTASITAFGRHDYLISDFGITSTATATQLGNSMLAAYRDPPEEGSFRTLRAGLRTGQRINIHSAIRGINRDYIIEQITLIPRGLNTFEYKINFKTQRTFGIAELFQNQKFTAESVNTSLETHINAPELDHRNLSITSIKLVDLSVTETKLADLAVATGKIRDDAVTAAKVWRGGAVITLSAQIGTGIIQTAHIGSLQVVTAHIADLAVNTAKIADLAVNNAKIADLAVNNAKIADLAVNNAKISDLSADKINVGTITGRRIRTSGAGSRVELIEGGFPSWPDSLVFFNLHGSAVGDIRGGADWVICSGTYMFPSGTGARAQCVWEGAFGFRSLEVWETSLRTRHIIPLDNTSDLGTSANRWQDIFVGRNIRILPQTLGVAVAGTLMFQSANNRLQCHDGTAWRIISWT